MKTLITLIITALLTTLAPTTAQAQQTQDKAWAWEKPSTQTPTNSLSATIQHPTIKWDTCQQTDHINTHVTMLGSGGNGRLDAGIMTWCNWQNIAPFYYVYLNDDADNGPGHYVNLTWPIAKDTDGDGIYEGHIEIVKSPSRLTWLVYADGALLAEVSVDGVSGRSGMVLASQSRYGQTLPTVGGLSVFTDLTNDGEPWDRGGAQSYDGCSRFQSLGVDGLSLRSSVTPGISCEL